MSPRRSFADIFGVLLVISTVSAAAAIPESPSAHQIMEKNFFASKLRLLKSDSTMLLVNDRGQTRERKSTTLTKLQKNGIDSKLLVRFLSPADIKGTSFLQVEHAEGDDDQWIYLSALKKSRRLVANNKKDSFVGSDFACGDILLPKVDFHRHTLLRTETIDAKECYVVESVPRDDNVKRDSGYSKKITWVRKDNFLETKVEYHDLAGRLLKTQSISDHQLVELDTQRWFALRREMVNHQTGHKTIITFARIESGVLAAEDLFTTCNLERE